MWNIFRKYHYLNHELGKQSECYVAYINNKPVVFMAIIHFPHPIIKNLKKIHRLVVLPDYQGIGLGKIVMNYVGEILKKENLKLGITTSQPSLNYSLKFDKKWKLIRIGRVGKIGKTSIIKNDKTLSTNRITTSWIYDN